jgi:hypothetical protein
MPGRARERGADIQTGVSAANRSSFVAFVAFFGLWHFWIRRGAV